MNIYQYFEDIVRSIKDPVVFELGANIGTDTDKLATILSRYHVNYIMHVFEPDARVKGALMSLNAKHAFHLCFYECAVGSEDKVADFYLSGGGYTGSSSIRKPKHCHTYWPDMTFETDAINVVKLDSFCQARKIDHIDFIWADVQGAEEDMIRGAREILKFTKYLYTEYCDLELYEGEIGLQGILELLPDWELVENFNDGNVLLRNKELT